MNIPKNFEFMIQMSSILSISGNSLSENCEDVVSILKKFNINGFSVPNKTVVDGQVENGCQIHIFKKPFKKNTKIIWDECKEKLKLTCAHVRIMDADENGCILDVLRESVCPGKCLD